MNRADRQLIGNLFASGLTLLFLTVYAVRADVAISPAYVEVQLDRGRPAGRFLVSNLGDEQERFRVKAIHFTYSAEGGLSQAATGENSLAQWVLFNPTELTIAGKTQQAVRFAIIPRGVLQNGEYWAAMELESLRKQETTTKDAEGRTVNLKVVATVMVPIFGTVGNVNYEGSVKEMKLVGGEDGTTNLDVLVSNTGTGRLGAKGTYEILNAAGQVVDKGQVGSAYILRGAERRFSKKLEPDLPQGRYIIKVSYTAPHLKAPIERETQVDWKPPPRPSTKPATQPTTATRPASQPATATGPSTQPTTATGPSTQPTTATRPVTQPTTATRPVTQPTTATKPVTQPTTATRPITQPTTATKPVTQPSTATRPVTHPTTATKPVTQPTTATKPVTQPTTATRPVTQPTTATKPVTQPTTATKPVTQPTTATKPVTQPTTATRPVTQPTTATRPVTQPATATRPIPRAGFPTDPSAPPGARIEPTTRPGPPADPSAPPEE